jgi:hypothetical protein
MNRAERRRNEREAMDNARILTLTHAELMGRIKNAMLPEIAKIKKDTFQWSKKYMLAVILMAVHDTTGFGTVRLQRIIDKANEMFVCASDGDLLNIDHVVEACRDLGLEIK